MNKLRIISLLCAVVLLILSFSISCVAEGTDPLYTISANPTTSIYSKYKSTGIKVVTAAELETKGIPSGYDGDVYSVVGKGSKAPIIDFSAAKIPTSVIDTMTFKIYVGSGATAGGYPQIRISKPQSGGNDSWIVKKAVDTTAGKSWASVVLKSDGTGFASTSYGFKNLSVDGYLAAFGLTLRHTADSTDIIYYIDDIILTYKTDDGVAPVITYTGEDVIEMPEFSEIPTNATAYDDFEKRNVDIYWEWPEGTKMTEKGTPVVGTYNANLCAKDFYGNTSRRAVKVVILQADFDAPEITLKADKVYAVAGTIPRLSIKATDDVGVKRTNSVWSENALDKRGRLTAGTHTWTVTAEDLSGNKTTKTVTVYVTDNENLGPVVFDEELRTNGGDLDVDGKLTPKDLVQLKKIVLFTGNADINGDGLTNILDFILLTKSIVND